MKRRKLNDCRTSTPSENKLFPSRTTIPYESEIMYQLLSCMGLGQIGNHQGTLKSYKISCVYIEL